MSPGNKFSYDVGLLTEPLLGYTLNDHLDLMCAQDPDRDCVVSCLEGVRLTYSQFKAESEKLAAAMIATGIEPGDRVGIWSTNNYRWLVVLYAVARVGALLVNINPGYKASELSFVLNQSGVKLLFLIAGNRGVSYIDALAACRSIAVPVHLEKTVLMPSVDLSGAPCPVQVKYESSDQTRSASNLLVPYDAFLATGKNFAGSVEARSRAIQFDDAVNIQYTSGTTGFPKGVTLSHHNLLNNGFCAARAMSLSGETRFCIPMPFYHCGGMVSSALATLSVGGTIIIPGPYFEELTVMKAVQKEKATHISGVPTMFIGQLEHAEFAGYDYTSLRGGFMAGAPCPVQLMRRVASEMHVPEVVILYGLTEVSPLMTATNTTDSMEARATTVGRAIAGVEVKVIDTTNGALLPRGNQGEICARGHGIMLGYWQNDQATAECIDAAGWLHSGDLGVMSAEGYLHITGRKKDMIIRGGENIYPREIEEVATGHPAVAQAQVFGLPDRRLGEEVAMWVALKHGRQDLDEAALSAELTAYLSERLAHFKIPRHIRFVSEFPMTVTGKIQKFAMRAAMVRELGLETADAIETA